MSEERSQVSLRYWAAVRAAAGVDGDEFAVEGPVTLEWLVAQARARHADRPRFAQVVSVCSVLVGERPVSTQTPAAVVVQPGDTVELLPPFAGGAR